MITSILNQSPCPLIYIDHKISQPTSLKSKTNKNRSHRSVHITLPTAYIMTRTRQPTLLSIHLILSTPTISMQSYSSHRKNISKPINSSFYLTTIPASEFISIIMWYQNPHIISDTKVDNRSSLQKRGKSRQNVLPPGTHTPFSIFFHLTTPY